MNNTILMADDDPEDRMIMEDAFQALGGQELIIFAENGVNTLQILEERLLMGSLPKLVVLDLNMPIMNGTQTLSKMKIDDRFSHIPVIIYSTSINPLERDKCLSLGARSYVTKPLSHLESIEVAKQLIAFLS